MYIYKGRLLKISEKIAFLFYKEIYKKYLILYYKTEILLKVALSTINQTINHKSTATFHEISYIRVITKLPNSEQSYKGKVKTHISFATLFRVVANEDLVNPGDVLAGMLSLFSLFINAQVKLPSCNDPEEKNSTSSDIGHGSKACYQYIKKNNSQLRSYNRYTLNIFLISQNISIL
jgi:spore coat protein CotH